MNVYVLTHFPPEELQEEDMDEHGLVLYVVAPSYELAIDLFREEFPEHDLDNIGVLNDRAKPLLISRGGGE